MLFIFACCIVVGFLIGTPIARAVQRIIGKQ
jgi:hypothetical protein